MNNVMNLVLNMLGSGNPQQMAQSIMANNPQAKAIYNQMQQSGMTAEQFARQIAKQNGVQLDPIVNTLRQRGMKI